ncbi:MAG: UvrD-helicase domain-containing protein [Treponema sp.]|nr:UvrD-helicase domain-containing protein [Treponema sp.]MEE3434907.1 UvrD-helicase domain-containing protein [Treponema sp.]
MPKSKKDHDIFARLNPEQLDAVQSTEGHIRVLAGAGSGKTRALVSRYVYLVRDLGISPKNILCVTFTNRAAEEMKMRVRRELGDLDLGYICTFHAFCALLLHEDINKINFPKDFVVLDKEDWRSMLLRIFADMGLTLKEATIQQKIDEVLEAKKMQADTYIDYFYKLNNEELKEKFSKKGIERNQEIFLRFLYEQKKCFGVDFNDLINFAVYILEKFPDVAQKWQDRIQYIMVDEFQDVSAKQYSIAQILSRKHKNLFIVGDSDQTIYSWRGSHVKLILDFDKKYKDARTILLLKNYRSTPQILTAANSLIAHNTVRYPKELSPTKKAGQKPLYYHAPSEEGEAKWICKKVKELCGLAKKSKAKQKADEAAAAPLGLASDSSAAPNNLRDIAILYRAHYLSRSLEEAFIKNDIPYRILAGTEFYGRREIKDMISYLRMLTVADDVSFYRTVNLPSRKIGKNKIAAIKERADKFDCSAYTALKGLLAQDDTILKGTKAQAYVDAIEESRALLNDKNSFVYTVGSGTSKLGSVLQSILDKSGYEAFLRLEADQDRLDNAAEFKRAVNQAGFDDDATLEDFLQRAALFTDLDREDKRDAVKMLTIHAAKGMEFKNVFLCGMNEGIFPSRKVQTPEDMEEERRIAYVAMTRAKDRLYITDAEGKANDGIFKYPSRFVFEAAGEGMKNFDIEKPLDKGLVEQSQKIIKYDESRLKAAATQLKKGDRVRHKVFGAGTIVLVNDKAFCYTIKFDDLATERSVQFSAPLELIAAQ